MKYLSIRLRVIIKISLCFSTGYLENLFWTLCLGWGIFFFCMDGYYRINLFIEKKFSKKKEKNFNQHTN